MSHTVCRHWSIIIEWIPESVWPDKFEIVYGNFITGSFDQNNSTAFYKTSFLTILHT